jgi:pimeloyl-ACP methyl ester carboxylesterase
MRTVETRRFELKEGLTLAADEGGDPASPTVILMHGGGQTRHSWRSAVQELLRLGFHVINLDARGHGDSDWPSDADYSIEAFAADIKEVVASLPYPPALVGASMGGMSALYAAGTSTPDFAWALVLVDIAPQVEPAGAAKIREFMLAHPDGFATVEEAAEAVAQYNPHRPRPKDTTGLTKNLRRRPNGRWYWHWDPRFTERARLLGPQVTEQMLTAAGSVRTPTLLVRGLMSDVVSESGVEEFRNKMPDLEVHDVSGAGHMVAGDKNDAFNRGVIDFLSRHVPSGLKDKLKPA